MLKKQRENKVCVCEYLLWSARNSKNEKINERKFEESLCHKSVLQYFGKDKGS